MSQIEKRYIPSLCPGCGVTILSMDFLCANCKASEQKITPAKDPLLTSCDAQLWAREFMRVWAGRWAEVDEALMIAWFANAIMRGYDEASARASRAYLADREKIAAQDVELGNLRQAKFWAVEREARLRDKIAALEAQLKVYYKI